MHKSLNSILKLTLHSPSCYQSFVKQYLNWQALMPLFSSYNKTPHKFISLLKSLVRAKIRCNLQNRNQIKCYWLIVIDFVLYLCIFLHPKYKNTNPKINRNKIGTSKWKGYRLKNNRLKSSRINFKYSITK